MGLFDSIAGQVLGSLGNSQGGQHAGLMEAIGGLINNPQTGGLQGLITTFEQKGMGEAVTSWVGTGQNLSITVEQLQSVLGNEQVQAMAAKLGISTQEVSAHLTELLPKVIDQLTPGGAVPDHATLGGLLGMLKTGLG